ncbi:pentatricopeptide repeat-containing protein At1g28690, mitochondrial-like [Selaginella moellendorffii]|uniref:pentatricopeptide repeat-containing protein At1g28690, mitochondrial-like n=1 Tax=Selaginella moellendorffii TaxID=88036 RepID=UPI000D1C5331|nr:pentatricopeptide repeat-containing protein At1g28690, mitochondrial-like [Selaginella moellendorffii]|eukprot:XP_024542373.1 pentatricopeptide repeat-containing protein At1g28690, mitochondrial-like [Selaginella moellendorffii]
MQALPLGGNSWSFYAQLIKRCGASEDCAAGRAAHRELQRLGIDQDTYLGNLLVQMYGKCGYVEEAMAVFQRIKDRNVFSWTILMDACTENGLSELTLELFRRMLLEGIRPDRVAYLGVLKACSELRYLEEGREVENLLLWQLGKCEKGVREFP